MEFFLSLDMGSPRRHHAYTERGTDRNGERHCVEDPGWRSASGGVHGEVTASTSRFRRLVFEKFEEEMQSQLGELTAQEFLDCGYGNEMEKYSHVVHRKAHRERSPTKSKLIMLSVFSALMSFIPAGCRSTASVLLVH